jgi:fumarate hydratase class I
MLGIGIGGTAEKAVLLAKESLMDDIDMYELQAKSARGEKLSQVEEMRLELYEKVNALGIGAQGLGGLTTVLDIKIRMYPTHAAGKPVAMIPNCAATRHAHFVMDGSGPVYLEAPSLDLWPKVEWAPDTKKSKRVNLDTLTREEVASWKPGDTLLLQGKMLTGRDAAHKRIQDMLAKGEKLPVDFTNRVIYYVGPVDPVKGEAVGPAGPTTATRMDSFTEMMLAQTGLIAMIGKAERGPTAIQAIQKHKSAYLMAVGGAAYLVSKAIKTAKVVGFADLGMEAIYEFDVVDMPVTVAVDAGGTSAHITGPAEWSKRIATANSRAAWAGSACWPRCAPSCRTRTSCTSRTRPTRRTASAGTPMSSSVRARWSSTSYASTASRRWWWPATRRPPRPSTSCARRTRGFRSSASSPVSSPLWRPAARAASR